MGRVLRLGCLGFAMVMLTSCDHLTAFQARYGEVPAEAWQGITAVADELVPPPEGVVHLADFPGMIVVDRENLEGELVLGFADGHRSVTVHRDADGLLVLFSMYVNEFPSEERIVAMDRYQRRVSKEWGGPVPRPPFFEER